MIIVETSDLSKLYTTSTTSVQAVNNINLQVEKGEFISIVGKSGSGKSTLLHIIGGLEAPTSGKVFISDQDIYSLKMNPLAKFRRKNIGFVFQSYNLLPIMNVYDNILLPLNLDNQIVDEDYFDEIISFLDIEDKLYEFPNILSGGEQQRVAIARALVTKPALLLADEPTGNLDTQSGNQVISLLKKSAERFNQTIILVTHNLEIAASSDRIVKIVDGRMEADAFESK